VTPDVDRSPVAADVWPLLRDGLAWVVAATLAVLAGVLAVLIDDRPGLAARVVFTAVPLGVLAVAFALTLRHGTMLATGALAIAVTPAALAAVAAGGQWGAVAVLVTSGAVALALLSGRGAPAIAAIAVAFVTVVGVGAWAAATPDELTRPSWGQATKRTGELLWTSVGSLDATQLVPATGWLIWWVAAGLVAGAALVAGAVRVAVLIPLAAAVMVAAGWAIIRWRGDVDMSGGAWILAAAVAYTGASVRLDPPAARRIGVTLLVVAAFIWTVTIVQLARN
jgi:hypothetical protein